MNTIQKKIWMLAGIVIVMMFAIWLALTFYNQKMQDQYNDILERYLQMNEVTASSQQTVTNLNDHLSNPTARSATTLVSSQQRLQDAQASLLELRNADNEFSLTNYSNMIESFTETVERSVTFSEQGENDIAASEFTEANRMSVYISEMTLSIFNSELRTYERFYRDIIRQSQELNTMGILLLSLTSVLLLLFTYLFSLSITKPVHQLTKAANELAKGRFDQPIRVNSNDEISFLAKTFDHMRVNINKLILEIQQKAQVESELQESQLLLQQSQMRHLQSQINPHFLFNTLNTLSKKAYLDGAEDTSDLLVSVAGLLRYNLKRLDHTVTLEEESHVLRQYMDIQKARFSDRLTFHIDLDASALVYQMPSLTLQPLIENAVIHGIEPKEDDGEIWFRIKDEDQHIRIEIEDNGEGMDRDKIEQLLKGGITPQEGHATGIGFANVAKRLQLFYGRDNVVEIESLPKCGTKIILKLPKVMEVESYV
ncbi:sensor histidine kinase [Planococcus maritimus]|uniref:sensor histidine kinase n=1 Tax=Planococcus maritimus TaxID=192421 RepID=UPI0007965EF3|nr:sensor histidine kinase [Planococcus maritimus]KYG58545.1 two-component sensor histidine kinase [Planococcus maritimus]OED31714.1 two-component sensor histidine kinase [Planococcus maritimus]